MELYGIILAGPAAFVASIVYTKVLDGFLAGRRRARKALFSVSLLVLGLIAVEIAILAAVGAVRARGTLGPGFEVVHTALMILGMPSLANALVLRPAPGVVARWYVVAPLCAAFAVLLVLMQYHVFESLYGVDGSGGPFGKQLSAAGSRGIAVVLTHIGSSFPSDRSELTCSAPTASPPTWTTRAGRSRPRCEAPTA